MWRRLKNNISQNQVPTLFCYTIAFHLLNYIDKINKMCSTYNFLINMNNKCFNEIECFTITESYLFLFQFYIKSMIRNSNLIYMLKVIKFEKFKCSQYSSFCPIICICVYMYTVNRKLLFIIIINYYYFQFNCIIKSGKKILFTFYIIIIIYVYFYIVKYLIT